MVLRRAMITLRLTDLSRSGSALGRLPSGEVVFVPFGAPGDLARVSIVKKEKRYLFGRLEEILEPSPLRVQPHCSAFTKCGGCSWQHLPYDLQWKTKLLGLKHALKRVELPGVESTTEIEPYPATLLYGYRNRIQLRALSLDPSPDAPSESSEEIVTQFGFFAPESRTFVPIQDCQIAKPELNSKMNTLKRVKLLQKKSTPTSQAERQAPPPSTTPMQKLELELQQNGQITETWNSKHGALGFQQINSIENEKLRTWVFEQFKNFNGQLLDLYGGNGNLSEKLFGIFDKTYVVDAGAPRTPLKNVRYFRMPVERFLKHQDVLTPHLNTFCITDPPREGLIKAKHFLARTIQEFDIKNWIHIGCDPDAFARDLKWALQLGFKIQKLAAFDFFPQTPHIESAVYLTRTEH